MGHDDLICHATGEVRHKTMGDLKALIKQMDDSKPTKTKPVPVGLPEGRPLRKYIGYIEQKYPITPSPYSVERPLITNIQVHETRLTSEYEKMKSENTRVMTYKDACPPTPARMPPPWQIPRTKSQELRGGVLQVGCDCTRKNGLQDDCQRWECAGSPECVAKDPGPCCMPSMSPKPTRGEKQMPQHYYNNCY